MGLEEFGTEADVDSKTIERPCKEVPPCASGCEDRSDSSKLTQFASVGHDEYMAVGSTRLTLPPGVYRQYLTQKNDAIFLAVDLKVDQLIELPDSLHKSVLDEISDFWTRGDKFKDYGFLHRRGYLLYGPQGGGKTCIVQQVIHKIVSGGDVVMLGQHPETLIRALFQLRQVEPNRRIVCVFEDIDAIVKDFGEDRLLALLDGENQIDKVLNVATTNYPERLDPRIVSRPRRFDRVIKVGMPSESVRKEYLKNKLHINGDDLNEWVVKSDGLSFAALAEMVISVKCLGNDLDATVKILRDMAKSKISSADYVEPIGIRR